MEARSLPDGIESAELRAAVGERYARVASEPDARYSFRVGRAFAEALGYPSDLLDTVPARALDAFTGVAAPVLRAELRPGERVLDLGCGSGLDLTLASRFVGPHGRAVGIDMAAPMVERARDTVRHAGLTQVAVCLAYAEALPLPDASVDCVLANGILNLSPDKSAVLAEIARVLKPGGRLVLAETTLRHPLPPGQDHDLESWFT